MFLPRLHVGVDIVKPTSKGDLVGKLEADFMGSGGDNGNGSVRVRHAYISLGNWLIGRRLHLCE